MALITVVRGSKKSAKERTLTEPGWLHQAILLCGKTAEWGFSAAPSNTTQTGNEFVLHNNHETEQQRPCCSLIGTRG